MLKIRIVIVALALTFAACGGASDGADTTAPPDMSATTTAPAETTAAPATTTAAPVATTSALPAAGAPVQMAVVHSAIDKVAAEPPAHIEGIMEMAGIDSDLGPIDLSIPFSASFDFVTGDGHMMMDFSSMAEMMAEEAPEFADAFGRFEIRQIGETAYVNFGLLTMMFGVETEWLAMPVEDGEGFATGFTSGINPYDATEFLTSLSASGGELTVLGTESLRGIETTHYRAHFDLEALAKENPEAFAELQESGPMDVDELPVELWIDGQGRIHRYLFELDGSETRGLEAGEEFDYMRVQFDFSDFGGRATIDPPPADQVTDIGDLGDMFGSFDV